MRARTAEGDDLLGPRVRALFSDLVHAGDLAAAAAPAASDAAQDLRTRDLRTGEAGCAAQGTRVRFSLVLADTHLEQVRYRAYGCPFTLASCEWLARQLTGRQLPEVSAQAIRAAVGTPQEWAVALGIPLQRLGRLLVVEDALQQAVGGRAGATADAATQHQARGASPSAAPDPRTGGSLPGSDDSVTDSG